MEIIRTLTMPAPQVVAGIFELVESNVASLSKLGVGADSPLFDYIKVCLKEDINFYIRGLERSPHPDMLMELMLVTEPGAEPGQDHVIGFLLFIRRRGATGSCAVSYTAVHEGRRRQGILRAMMNVVREHYPIVSLTGSIESVPVYEALGFTIRGTEGTQVAMAAGEVKGVVWAVDETTRAALPTIQATKVALKKKFGKKAAEQYNIFNRHLQAEVERVAEFVEQRRQQAAATVTNDGVGDAEKENPA